MPFLDGTYTGENIIEGFLGSNVPVLSFKSWVLEGNDSVAIPEADTKPNIDGEIHYYACSPGKITLNAKNELSTDINETYFLQKLLEYVIAVGGTDKVAAQRGTLPIVIEKQTDEDGPFSSHWVALNYQIGGELNQDLLEKLQELINQYGQNVLLKVLDGSWKDLERLTNYEKKGYQSLESELKAILLNLFPDKQITVVSSESSHYDHAPLVAMTPTIDLFFGKGQAEQAIGNIQVPTQQVDAEVCGVYTVVNGVAHLITGQVNPLAQDEDSQNVAVAERTLRAQHNESWIAYSRLHLKEGDVSGVQESIVSEQPTAPSEQLQQTIVEDSDIDESQTSEDEIETATTENLSATNATGNQTRPSATEFDEDDDDEVDDLETQQIKEATRRSLESKQIADDAEIAGNLQIEEIYKSRTQTLNPGQMKAAERVVAQDEHCISTRQNNTLHITFTLEVSSQQEDGQPSTIEKKITVIVYKGSLKSSDLKGKDFDPNSDQHLKRIDTIAKVFFENNQPWLLSLKHGDLKEKVSFGGNWNEAESRELREELLRALQKLINQHTAQSKATKTSKNSKKSKTEKSAGQQESLNVKVEPASTGERQHGIRSNEIVSVVV